MAEIIITIDGLTDTLRALDRIKSHAVLRVAMTAAVEYVWERLQIYPAPVRKKYPWKTVKQRNYVIRAIRLGMITVPYKRRHSGGLAGRWQRRVSGHGEAIIGELRNIIPYGPYVMDPTIQSAYHRGVWPTTQTVAERESKNVAAIFEKTIRSSLKL